MKLTNWGSIMEKEKLLYEYTYTQYLSQTERKKELRNRSSFFIGLGFPITISFIISSIKSTDQVSEAQGVLLLISGILLIVSLVSFLMIYLPSKQKTYYPEQIIKDFDNLETSKEYLYFLTSQKSETQKEQAKEYLSLRFFSNTYAQLYQLYEDTHKKFKKYFLILALSLSISLILTAISFVV
jgi:hypothetical protein